jgi:hypothetical protein|tara:strand:- start:1 stop:471 length:471 start_codon:yes stop_codon:yes gene_type:complete
MKAKLLLASLLTFFIFLGGVSIVFADCTGCGDDGHQVCPIEDKAHKHITVMTEEHKTSTSQPEDGVVFAVCIFEIDEATGERKLIDHRASENLMDCLKNKREAERDYKEKKEKGGIFNMTCDKVDAKVEVQADGSWKILEILGRHEQAYERKKVYE